MTEPTPPRFANMRDSVATLREFIIVIAMLSILFAPGRVKGILEDAGIRSLAGVEFDATNLSESEASVKEAHAHISELKQQLALAQQELSKVASAGGRTLDPGLGAISELLAGAQRATVETETNLNRSQEKTRDFFQQHGRRYGFGHKQGLSHDHDFAPGEAATTQSVRPRPMKPAALEPDQRAAASRNGRDARQR